jgi:hypothetical protein
MESNEINLLVWNSCNREKQYMNKVINEIENRMNKKFGETIKNFNKLPQKINL